MDVGDHVGDCDSEHDNDNHDSTDKNNDDNNNYNDDDDGSRWTSRSQTFLSYWEGGGDSYCVSPQTSHNLTMHLSCSVVRARNLLGLRLNRVRLSLQLQDAASLLVSDCERCKPPPRKQPSRHCHRCCLLLGMSLLACQHTGHAIKTRTRCQNKVSSGSCVFLDLGVKKTTKKEKKHIPLDFLITNLIPQESGFVIDVIALHHEFIENFVM